MGLWDVVGLFGGGIDVYGKSGGFSTSVCCMFFFAHLVSWVKPRPLFSKREL